MLFDYKYLSNLINGRKVKIQTKCSEYKNGLFSGLCKNYIQNY